MFDTYPALNEWIHTHNLDQFAEAILKFKDLLELLNAQNDDLVNIGISKNKDRKRILYAISKTKENSKKDDKKKSSGTLDINSSDSNPQIEVRKSTDKEKHGDPMLSRDSVEDHKEKTFRDLDLSPALSDLEDDPILRRARSNSDSSEVKLPNFVDIRRRRSGDRLCLSKRIEGVLSIKKPGFLGLMKRWEPRWCVFDGRRFLVYKSRAENTPILNIDVTKAIVSSLIGRKGDLIVMEIIAEGKRTLWLGNDMDEWITTLERVSSFDIHAKRRTSDVLNYLGGMTSSSEEDKQSLDVATESEDRLAGSTEKMSIELRLRKKKIPNLLEDSNTVNTSLIKEAIESYEKSKCIKDETEDHPSEELEYDNEPIQKLSKHFLVISLLKQNEEKPKWNSRWCEFDGCTVKTYEGKDLTANPISVFDLSHTSVNPIFLNKSLCMELLLNDRREIWKGADVETWLSHFEQVSGRNLPHMLQGVLVRKKRHSDTEWVARYCTYNEHQFQIFRYEGDPQPLVSYPSRYCSARKSSKDKNCFELLFEGEVRWIWWTTDGDSISDWAKMIRERHEKAVASATKFVTNEWEEEFDEYFHGEFESVLKGEFNMKGAKKVWEKKKCELRGRVLYIYKTKGEKKSLELEIPLSKADVRSIDEDGQKTSIEVKYGNKKIILVGEDTEVWSEALKSSMMYPDKRFFTSRISDLSAAESRSEDRGIVRETNESS